MPETITPVTMVRVGDYDQLHSSGCADLSKHPKSEILGEFKSVAEAKTTWTEDDADLADDESWWDFVRVMPCAEKAGK